MDSPAAMSKVRPFPVSIGCVMLVLSGIIPAPWGAAGADSSADKNEGKPRSGLMVLSKTSDPKVFSPIPGAQTTVLAAAYEWEYGVRVFPKEEWLKRGYEWTEFLANAVRMADRLVGEIEPIFQRDRRGVIDFAVLTHDDPFLSSIILSPKLLKRFEEQFGKRLHLLVLDRNRIFVFPADGGRIEGFANSLIDQYYEARHPVSLELFLIDETGYRVIGALER
jgi:hypothetical protein